MIEKIRKFLGDSGESQHEGRQNHDVRIAVCALLLEMANIDGEFSDSERDAILRTLKEEYELDDGMAQEIMEAAAGELSESLDLWTFTNLINQNFSEDEKIKVVEMLWKVLYADGILDKHEDYLVRKLNRLLRLNLRKLVQAKQGAKDPDEDIR